MKNGDGWWENQLVVYTEGWVEAATGQGEAKVALKSK